MYIILEIQTTGTTPAITPAIVKSDPAEAESAYLMACASACISSVEKHAVLCFDEEGNHVFDSPRCYEHTS